MLGGQQRHARERHGRCMIGRPCRRKVNMLIRVKMYNLWWQKPGNTVSTVSTVWFLPRLDERHCEISLTCLERVRIKTIGKLGRGNSNMGEVKRSIRVMPTILKSE